MTTKVDSTSQPAERICALRHPLKQLPTAPTSPWPCSGCRTTRAPRETCFSCGTCKGMMVCKNCVLRPTCKGNHIPAYVPAHPPGSWSCNGCNQPGAPGAACRRCEPCNFHLCLTCCKKSFLPPPPGTTAPPAEPPKKQLQYVDPTIPEHRIMTLPPPERFCQKHHPLGKVPTTTAAASASSSSWLCNGCKVTFSTKEVRYTCGVKECSEVALFVCQSCFEGPPCKGQHVLPIIPGATSRNFTCNGCRRFGRPGVPARTCYQCDFDLCMTCFGKDRKRMNELRRAQQQTAAATAAPAKQPQTAPATKTPAPAAATNTTTAAASGKVPAAQPAKTPPAPTSQTKTVVSPAPPAVSTTTASASAVNKSTVRGLFIGINYVGSKCPLRGCVSDVCVMHKFLTSIGMRFTEKRFLVDDREEFPHPVYAMPERKHILDSLRWLVAGAKAGDTLFLHYSGHGGRLEDQDGDEDDGYDETLVPLDYKKNGEIRDDDIFEIVCRNLPKGVRLTAVTDCCHSGTVMDLEYNWAWDGKAGRFRDPSARKKKNKNQQQVVTRDFHQSSAGKTSEADILLLSGCNDSQTSADITLPTLFFEHPFDGPGASGGACTNALIAALSKQFNKPGTGKYGSCIADISYGEMLIALQDALKKEDYTQIPQLSSSRYFSMDDLFGFVGPL